MYVYVNNFPSFFEMHNVGNKQCNIQERGASGDCEFIHRESIDCLLLQSEGQHSHRTRQGARKRGQAYPLPGNDVQRVQNVH